MADACGNKPFSSSAAPAGAQSMARRMGRTDELNIGYYFKRLTAIGATFGDSDHRLSRFGPAVEQSSEAMPAAAQFAVEAVGLSQTQRQTSQPDAATNAWLCQATARARGVSAGIAVAGML